jgi:hypothetical protein
MIAAFHGPSVQVAAFPRLFVFGPELDAVRGQDRAHINPSRFARLLERAIKSARAGIARHAKPAGITFFPENLLVLFPVNADKLQRPGQPVAVRPANGGGVGLSKRRVSSFDKLAAIIAGSSALIVAPAVIVRVIVPRIPRRRARRRLPLPKPEYTFSIEYRLLYQTPPISSPCWRFK